MNLKKDKSGIQRYSTPLGQVKYRVRVWMNTKRVSKSFSSIGAAKIWAGRLEEAKAEAKVSGLPAVATDTFGELVKSWHHSFVMAHWSPSMQKCSEQIIRAQFLPQVGDLLVDEITHQNWQALLGQLRISRAWSHSTFNRRRALLMSFYNWCVDEGYCHANPIKRIKRLKEQPKETQFLSSEELRRYVDVLHGYKHATAFFILLNTGMRIGEVLGLTWGDIDFQSGWIRISKIYCKHSKMILNKTKGNKIRIVGLNESLAKVLKKERNRELGTTPTDLVIVSSSGKSPGHDTIQQSHDWALKSAKIRKIGIHALRHTYASHFMMNGGSLWDLKTILGHSTINLTDRYSHFGPDYLKEKAERFSIEATSVEIPDNVVMISGKNC